MAFGENEENFVTTGFHYYNSEDSGQLIYNWNDHITSSDMSTHVTQMGIGAVRNSDSDSNEFMESNLNHQVSALKAFGSIVVAGAEQWLSMGSIRTWDQTIVDPFKPPKSTIAAPLNVVYLPNGNYVISRIDDLIHLKADAVTVIESVKAPRFVQNIWLGSDESCIQFACSRIQAFDIIDGSYYSWRLNSKAQPIHMSYLKSGWNFAFDGYYDQTTKTTLVLEKWTMVRFFDGTSDSDYWTYGQNRPYATSAIRNWVYQLEGERDTLILFFRSWRLELYDFEVQRITSWSNSDSFYWEAPGHSLIHFKDLDLVFGVSSDGSSVNFYDTSRILKGYSDFPDSVSSGFSPDCSQFRSISLELSAICFMHNAENLYILNFTTGVPQNTAQSTGLLASYMFPGSISFLKITDAFQIPDTAQIFSLTSLGIVIWNINEVFDREIVISKGGAGGCEDPCEECSDGNPSYCFSCNPDGQKYVYQIGVPLCEEYCPVGQVIVLMSDEVHYKCAYCEYPCQECKDDTSTCTKCLSYAEDNVLQIDRESCSDTCPKGQIKELYAAESYRCDSCLAPCETCVESKTLCTSCLTSSIYNVKQIDSNSCAKNCPDGQYIVQTDILGHKECRKCHDSCSKCENEVTCLSCKDGWVWGSAEGECIESCAEGFYADESDHCQACHETCLYCSGGGENNCDECKEGLYYSVDSGLCVEECPSGSYAGLSGPETPKLKSNTNVCITCAHPCKECSTSGKTCTSCQENYTLDEENNQCLKETDEGCSFPCETCSETKSKCDSCLDGYVLDEETSSCFKLQMECNGNCANCDIDGVCFKCNGGFYMFGGLCKLDCPEGYSKSSESGSCEQCQIENCQKCSNDSPFVCAQCFDGFLTTGSTCSEKCPNETYKLSDTCFESCPLTYFEDGTKCSKCGEHCESCAAKTSCTHCEIGYEADDGICRVESETSYSKASLNSDGIDGEIWDVSNDESVEPEEINPVFSHIYEPNQLEVIFLVKSSLSEKNQEKIKEKKQELVSFVLTGELNEETKTFEGKNPSGNYILRSDGTEYAEIRVIFELEESLLSSKIKVWIDPNVEWDPPLSSNLFTKEIGRLEFVSVGEKSTSLATGSASAISMTSNLVLSCGVSSLSPSFSVFLPEIILLSYIDSESPSTLSSFTNTMGNGFSLSSTTRPTEFLDQVFYKSVIEKKTGKDKERRMLVRKPLNRKLQSDDSEASSFSPEESKIIYMDLVDFPVSFRNQGKSLFVWTNLFYQLIIFLFLLIPLALSPIFIRKNSKVQGAVAKFIFKRKWQLPVSFILVQIQDICTAAFLPLATSSASSWPFFLNQLVGVLLIFLIASYFYKLYLFLKNFKGDQEENTLKTTESALVITHAKQIVKKPSMMLMEEKRKKVLEFQFRFILRTFKTEKLSQRMGPLILLAMIVLETAAAVFFIKHPGVVLSVFASCASLCVGYCIIFKPFVSKIHFLAIVVNKLLLILNYFWVFLYGFVLTEREEQSRKRISFIILGILVVQMITNIVFLVLAGVIYPLLERRAGVKIEQSKEEEVLNLIDGGHEYSSEVKPNLKSKI